MPGLLADALAHKYALGVVIALCVAVFLLQSFEYLPFKVQDKGRDADNNSWYAQVALGVFAALSVVVVWPLFTTPAASTTPAA